MKNFTLVLFAVILNLYGSAQSSGIKNGFWRGELKRDDGKNIVVNFEVSKKQGKTVVYILNATERLEADDITVEADSVFIKLPFFDSQFRVSLSANGTLNGSWRKRLADRDVILPFTAVHNQKYRFSTHSKSAPANVSGRWAVTFTDTTNNKKTISVGVFQQKENKVTGSFLTPFGDYRYLEGVIDGDSLKLSGFDGGYALLFVAKVEAGQRVTKGRFYSGAGPATQVWDAKKDPDAQLPDASAATHVRAGMQPRFDFTFKDVDGKTVSINDERFKNKVILVQILGSWCPNCLDETKFMGELYKEYKNKGVEIIGLAYERTEDFTRSQAAVKSFMKRLKVEYPVLIVPIAVSDPQRTEKTLPQLERIPAFPTTIFIDRKGEIQTIHSGFNGPGTGDEEYKKQKDEYYHIVRSLLAE